MYVFYVSVLWFTVVLFIFMNLQQNTLCTFVMEGRTYVFFVWNSGAFETSAVLQQVPNWLTANITQNNGLILVPNVFTRKGRRFNASDRAKVT